MYKVFSAVKHKEIAAVCQPIDYSSAGVITAAVEYSSASAALATVRLTLRNVSFRNYRQSTYAVDFLNLIHWMQDSPETNRSDKLFKKYNNFCPASDALMISLVTELGQAGRVQD
ncbi:hypothetical protein J6590_014603 [Homalodisca vitripennis]|nr:hypothetical protein J6590_014603 [Homalodisca vitripennis]